MHFFACEDSVSVLLYTRFLEFKTQVSQTAVDLVVLSKSTHTSAFCLQITLLAPVSNVQLSHNNYTAHTSGPVKVFLRITTDGMQVESRQISPPNKFGF